MQPVQILIVRDEAGRVSLKFSGTEDKCVLVGLLEVAKNAILNPREPTSPIMLAQGSLPNGSNQ